LTTTVTSRCCTTQGWLDTTGRGEAPNMFKSVCGVYVLVVHRHCRCLVDAC
jgi:hypothetical protein